MSSNRSTPGLPTAVNPTETPSRFLGPLRLRFREKLALWFSAVMLLSTCLAAWLIYVEIRRNKIDSFGRTLEAIAAGAAANVETDAFQTIRDPEDMKSPAYRRIKGYLLHIRKAVESTRIRVRFLYTMAPTDNPGIWRYVVDSQEETDREFSPTGATEDYSKGDVILDALHTGEPAVDRELKFYPVWKWVLSAAAPIKDRSGKVIGIVGIDAPDTAVQRLQVRVLQLALVALAPGLVLALVGSHIVAWRVTRPIGVLVSATEEISKGDLHYEVRISGRDELAQLGDAFNNMTAGLRQRDLYKQQFERYVSRQIAEKILSDPDTAFWEGERRRATILFADIRGFTAMSEHMPPEEVVQRLNEYLGIMIEIIFEYDGTLDKFIGDAVMAVFGAPVNMGNDEERAVRAAVAMQAAMAELRTKWAATGHPEFRIGIGINTGDVVMGNIGSDKRLEYAAIGDPVNLASRLEALNKEYGTDILISETTYESVARFVDVRSIDRVAVRGRKQPVAIYELLRIHLSESPAAK